MAKVSVIIPVYNARRYIAKCIKSIVNEMDDIEIIAVDDGSTDNSLDILYQLAQEYKGKIKIYSKRNGGAGSARNLGLDVSSGKYIKFVDADDTLVHGALQKMCDVAEDRKVQIVKGDYNYCIGPIKVVDSNDWTKAETPEGLVDISENKDWIVREYPNLGNKLFDCNLIGSIRFPEGLKWEDLPFVPLLMAKSGIMYYLKSPVYNYRIHANTTVTDFIKSTPNVYDIVKDGGILRRRMTRNGLADEYSEQIESLYVLHTLFRVENVMTWKLFPMEDKKRIVSAFLAKLDMEYPNWEDDRMVALYREKGPGFDKQMKKLYKFVDEEYRSLTDSAEIESTIANVFTKKR